MTQHEQLLEEAVENSSDWAGGLKNRYVLVTGASGFLASSLLVFLARLNEKYRLGLQLHATARRPVGEVPLFSFLNVAPPPTWELASVEESVIPREPGIIVVHTASFGSPRDYQREPLATFEANTRGILGLFERAAMARASRLFYFSSAEVYGQPPNDQIPTGEDYVGGLPTLVARSIYGESKRMAEVLGTCEAERLGVPYTVLRPWNLYGPGQRLHDGRVPMEFVRQAMMDGRISLLSNGSPRRCFCHVWTGIRQIAGLLAAEDSDGAWNIGFAGEEKSILETALCCAQVCGLPVNSVLYDSSAKAGGIHRSAPDISKVERKVGAVPCVCLDRGLQTMREWTEFLLR